jgi:hypothetical protein
MRNDRMITKSYVRGAVMIFLKYLLEATEEIMEID